MEIKYKNKTINIDDKDFFEKLIVKEYYIYSFASFYKIDDGKAERIVNDYYLYEDCRDERIVILMLQLYNEELYDYFISN